MAQLVGGSWRLLLSLPPPKLGKLVGDLDPFAVSSKEVLAKLSELCLRAIFDATSTDADVACAYRDAVHARFQAREKIAGTTEARHRRQAWQGFSEQALAGTSAQAHRWASPQAWQSW